MSKELKAPDKVTQKMTRDGAVAENLTTGETSSISERPQEENYSAPAGVAAEKVVQHIGAEIERHAAKGAEKKALDATQPKTHSSRLQFSEAERATPELQKAIKKSDKAADCLDAARAAIPKQTKIKKERVFDEAKGKAKTRLSFEKTDKPPNGKLRHNPLSRPAQELNSTVHGKIYEVEKENVGVESGHRVELAGEKAGGMAARAVKGGIRRHKLKPYRAAAAAEKQAVKANADFLYQKALHDNPALAHSNPISRFWQKQRIKKQYAKTLKAGGKAKKTAEATAKAAKKTAQETKRATFFVVRHWKGCLIVGGIAFIVLLLFGGLSSCSLFGGNSGSGLIASSYLSEDADITGAESAYAAMEAELQDMLDNIESEYPGYDEYRVNADEIEHDPYVLISILSAWHEGVFTLDEVQSTLEMLFEKQYILTVEEEVQVRYRTETRTDSEGNPYTVEVPYNYYILHAKLHDVDLNAPPEQQNRVDRHTCEVEAESVAYTVCQHFGLDTSDYSFGYVAGWSSGKEMTELKASLETIQTTAKELITEIEGHFTELQQQRQAEQEQGDTFSIYQLKRGDETRDLRFEPYDRLQAAGLTIDRVNYELVYTAPLTKDMTLGDIWERFNIDHPADFKGHSLSVSDIVVLHQNDEDTAHYVDSIGFQQVPEFLQEQQTPVFDKLPPEQQQALSDTVQDTLQMLVDADKRIYGDVTGKTLEAIAAQGYSYKDGQLEKQQPEATPDSLLTGETVRTPRGNFHITDMSREQIEAAGFGFHHASEDGKYLIMGNGTQAYAIAAEQPQRDNPLKHVEDTIEQNDNNFDGLINNTPQTPTVADFEQRAKAGEAISVTDLAKAVKAEKREQPQKKPSILKKLDEYKKQAAQQPKDKQKEHKKDLEV